MRIMMLALLLTTGLAFSATAFGADAVQDAYTAFETTADGIQQQLYAKQTELDALMANNQSQSPRVQELFREMGELEGQLFTARAELHSKIRALGGAPYARHGAPYRTGHGYGCCRGGAMHGGYYGGRYCW